MQERTAIGAMVLTVCRVVTKVIDLLTLLLLARVLLKEDFGLVATALIFVQIAEAIFDVPVFNVLLRLKSVTRCHLDNLFTLALLRGLAISSIMCALSYPIALFYEDQRLVALVCALSLAPALRGLRSPRHLLTTRNLIFLPGAIAETAGKIASLVIASSIAILTGSYWAIAAGTIATPVVSSIVSFCLLPTVPRLNLSHWKLFRGFLSWSMAGQAASAINWQCDRLVLGKVVTMPQLGLFSLARDLATNTIMAIVNTMHVPVLSALSAVQDDRERLASAYARAASAILSISLPIAIGQALVADALVPLMLGDKWTDVVPLFQLISYSLVIALYSTPTSAVFYAVGRPDLIFSRNCYDLIFRVPVTIVLSLMYGVMGAAYGLVWGNLFLAAICAYSVRNLTGLSLAKQLWLPVRGLSSCLFMAGAVELVRLVMPAPETHWQQLQFLALAVPAGGATYIAAHFCLWFLAKRPDGFERLLLDFGKRKLQKFKERASRGVPDSHPLSSLRG